MEGKQLFFGGTLMVAGFLITGCAPNRMLETKTMRSQLNQKEPQVSVNESSAKDRDATLASTQDRLKQPEMQRQAEADTAEKAKTQAEQSQKARVQATEDVKTSRLATNDEGLLPPGAKPGECYTRVFIPPQFRTETERVRVRDASFEIETVPAKYAWTEERVMVKAASERLEVVPATYKMVEERIMVKPASTVIENVPPVYEVVTERILQSPAHTVWKKGRGPIEKIDAATGEIMCLVEVPATYKTVTRRVVKTPATTRTVEVPAVYKTVQRRVMDAPPTTRTVTIPAEYKTVRVQKLVLPSQEKRIPVPEAYDTVTKTINVTEGRMEWRPILCETNVTPDVVTSIQKALVMRGHNPGPVDGRIGARTKAAVESFQKKTGLPQGGLTMDTIRHLGVKIGKDL